MQQDFDEGAREAHEPCMKLSKGNGLFIMNGAKKRFVLGAELQKQQCLQVRWSIFIGLWQGCIYPNVCQNVTYLVGYGVPPMMSLADVACPLPPASINLHNNNTKMRYKTDELNSECPIKAHRHAESLLNKYWLLSIISIPMAGGFQHRQIKLLERPTV